MAWHVQICRNVRGSQPDVCPKPLQVPGVGASTDSSIGTSHQAASASTPAGAKSSNLMPHGIPDHAAGADSATIHQSSGTASIERSIEAEQQATACIPEIAMDMSSIAEQPASRAIAAADIEVGHEIAALDPASALHGQSGALQQALEPALQPSLQAASDAAACHDTDISQPAAAKAGRADVMPDAVMLSAQLATLDDHSCRAMPADDRSVGQQREISRAEAAQCQPSSPEASGLLPVGITTYTGVGFWHISGQKNAHPACP